MQTIIWPILFNALVAFALVLYYFKDQIKAKKALELAEKSFHAIFPLIVLVVLFLILIQQLFSNQLITDYIISTSGVYSYIAAIVLGALVHIPLFITFPIGGQLLESGVNAGVIGVFITSLVMVHTFSIPIEIKELRLKFAVARNLLSLAAAVLIGIIIGVLY